MTEYPLHRLSNEDTKNINKERVREVINYLKLIPNNNFQDFGYSYENVIKKFSFTPPFKEPETTDKLNELLGFNRQIWDWLYESLYSPMPSFDAETGQFYSDCTKEKQQFITRLEFLIQ